MWQPAPPNSIRALGGIESFLEATHELFGSLRVIGVYHLTQPTNLENIRHAATYLRARHQILQCSVSFDWDTKAAHYIKADHLAPHIDHHADEHTMDEYIRKLVDGDFAPDVPGEDRQRAWHARCEKYLPWTIALIGRGDYVCFVGPHSICDGVSLDVIGGDIVRALNGQDVTDFLPIVQPVEPMFGNASIWSRIKMWFKLRLQPSTVDKFGLDSCDWSHDWRARKSIGKTLNVTLEDIEPFFAACRAQNVSLTSGVISTIYEVLGQRPELMVAKKEIAMYVPMDGRRRVENASIIPRDQIGAYNGACTISESGNNGHGQWALRAQRIHRSIHVTRNETAFIKNTLQAGMVSKMGAKVYDSFVNSEQFGRLSSLALSNIGRCTRIERANEECFCEATNGWQAIGIQRLYFEVAHRSVGAYLNVCMATVGRNVTIRIASCEPFFPKHDFNQIVDAILTRLCRAPGM